jgi:hypothetical protein
MMAHQNRPSLDRTLLIMGVYGLALVHKTFEFSLNQHIQTQQSCNLAKLLRALQAMNLHNILQLERLLRSECKYSKLHHPLIHPTTIAMFGVCIAPPAMDQVIQGGYYKSLGYFMNSRQSFMDLYSNPAIHWA